METLRRLRFVWALLCLIFAAACAGILIGNFGPPGVNMSYLVAWLIAAVCAALAFYMPSIMVKLSMLWLGGVGAFVFGSIMTQNSVPDAALFALKYVGAPWVVAAVVAWIVKPTAHSITRSNP